MTAILVTHPGLQHSHQLAWALCERGLLQAYWSGVPVLDQDEELPFWFPISLGNKIKRVAIPTELRRHPMIFQVLLRAGILLPSALSRKDYSHRVFHLYDWWVSKKILRLKPKIVVACENSAYHTFLAAKTIGALCILDAPSLHHVTSAKLIKLKPTPYLSEIDRRKDEEVALADLILTCSPLAAESYIENGVSASKVRLILLGATLPSGVKPWQKHSEPLHFIFAGTLRYLKSIDIILETFSRLNSEGFKYNLSFVGGQGENGWLEKIRCTPHAVYIGQLSQAELYQKFSQADCLLLPSRFDSFGMVVAEAMACGTPAIVSKQTGAKAMIEQFPKSGWIVDCNADELYSCVKERIQDREGLFAARDAALEASKEFTWQSYRKRVGLFIEECMK